MHVYERRRTERERGIERVCVCVGAFGFVCIFMFVHVISVMLI